jgi:hypothetical protein
MGHKRNHTATPERVAPPPAFARAHGAPLRGAEITRTSHVFEGRFGRMFRTLPAARFSEDILLALGEAMTAEAEDVPTPETEVDDEENQGIAAGFTYLGQFIDHDLTFDPASSLQKTDDPDALVDFRTPRFDLDSVYGRGPDDQPYLYRADGLRFLQGRELTGNPHDRNTRDVPRNTAHPGEPRRALLGDPRNDENVIVSQLHGVFLRFHNRVADLLTRLHGVPPTFAEVQREVRWHYQWVVLHDFLPTIVGQHLVDEIVGLDGRPDLRFFHWRHEPFMPVEFSVAAYRFGHSMVRPLYRLNTTMADRPAIFSNDPAVPSLNAFGEFSKEFAIDWSLFFDFDGTAPKLGKTRLQRAYKIDTSLVNPLGKLPVPVAKDIRSLAQRNLLRGWRMGLPSGQAVAEHMGLPVLPDEKLRVGKATEEDTPSNPLLTSLSPRFKHNAPLWYYVLAEAQQGFKQNDTPIRLGPVGGRIVAEVILGLLFGDSHAFVNQARHWKPRREFMQHGKFDMGDLVQAAIQG